MMNFEHYPSSQLNSNESNLISTAQTYFNQRNKSTLHTESNQLEASNRTGLSLEQQVKVSQFCSITGCSLEQSQHLLESSKWHYQKALSLFFDDYSICNSSTTSGATKGIINNASLLSLCAPSNTPVTPPNLNHLELAFSKLNASSTVTDTTTPVMSSNSSVFYFNSTLNDVNNNSNSFANNNNITTPNQNSKSGKTTMPMPIVPNISQMVNYENNFQYSNYFNSH